MEFVQLGDEHINLATVQTVTVSQAGDGVAAVTLRFLAGQATMQTYTGAAATDLLATLERATARAHSRDYRAS
jgi:hypothetical protein